jgi:23S rRNA (uracil1939-C5)-methyltransferase
MPSLDVTIDRIGDLGDGIAETPGGRLHVALTAPGDVARVTVTGKATASLDAVLIPGPARMTPPCGHFGRCGGCALQHLGAAFTASWKRERIVTALARAGLGGAPVAETLSVPPGTRRRATLAAKRFRGRMALGFTERASHQLVDLAECLVLRPELVAILPPLRSALSRLLEEGEAGDIAVTLTETGIDLVLIRPRPLSLIDRETLAALAEGLDLARVTWRPAIQKPAEPVAARRTPVVRLGVRAVALPPGGFLQPSAEGQALLTGLVMAILDGATGPIVDLFSGAGTFSFPAEASGPVAAYDGDAEAIAALRDAARGARISGFRRDLFREPLTAGELNGFAAAIIDPPRAGAQAQARMLADSGVPVIAFASCNPISFARDAAILTAGGYRLTGVTPVDQFPWSPHIELAAAFRR